MKKALTKGAKLLAINIAILIGSTIILYLFSIAIGITISNAIFKALGSIFQDSFSLSIKKFESRAITEPPTSTVIKGPREGFVESLSVNVSMMRRKLKSTQLVFCMWIFVFYKRLLIASGSSFLFASFFFLQRKSLPLLWGRRRAFGFNGKELGNYIIPRRKCFR